jgi:hypothetical protein
VPLARPLPLFAVALVALNDHVLKGSGLLPPALTGKISDFAGLFFFPLLLLALVEIALERTRYRPPRTGVLALAVLVTATGFCLVKLVPSVNRGISELWGPLTLDPTDLVALPMLGASALYALSPVRRRHDADRKLERRWVTALAVLAAAAVSIATPAPRHARNYPSWRVESLGARQVGCARFDAWIAKSGKRGVGITVELVARETCPVRVSAAQLMVGGERVTTLRLPEARTLEAGETTHAYLPFEFDNEAAWNRGVRNGQLELEIVAAGTSRRVALALVHVRDGDHRVVDRHGGSDASASPPP